MVPQFYGWETDIEKWKPGHSVSHLRCIKAGLFGLVQHHVSKHPPFPTDTTLTAHTSLIRQCFRDSWSATAELPHSPHKTGHRG